MSGKQLWILDGYNQIYKAFYVRGPELFSPTGAPTKGIYFFCRTLYSLIDRFNPAYLAIALDTSRKGSFRRALFKGYKQRRSSNEALANVDPRGQIQRVHEIVAALGIPCLKAQTFEADDVIATLVHRFASEDVHCVMVSTDKDLNQLVGPHAVQYDTQASDWLDAHGVRMKWGVKPSQVVDVQALAGDPMDCVPGVRGIGINRAVALIQRYGSVDGVKEALDDLPSGMQKRIKETDLDLSRKLVELRRDVPLDVELEDLEFNGLDHERAKPIYDELGFQHML